MSTYKLSPYVRIVSASDLRIAMAYHTLFGNPRVLNEEALSILRLFNSPVKPEELIGVCEGDPSPVVEEFKNIFFLVRPGFDERALLKVKKEEYLSMVEDGITVDRMGLAISDACNFACAHCIHFQPSVSRSRELPAYQRPITQLNMSWETAKKCIDRYVTLMKDKGDVRGKIHFGNAEPLINWPVIRRVLDYCRGIEGMTFEFAINTNLTLMTPKIAEILKRFKVNIAASLDGTQKANNAIRTTKGGRGTFDQIIEKFNLLGEVGYSLDGFSITVTQANFHLIDIDVIDLAIERFMTSIAFDYDLIGLIGVPISERIDKLLRFKRYANAHGIDFFGTWDSAFRNLLSESFLITPHTFCAAVAGKSLEFNVDGSIKVCGHTTTQIGHLDKFDHMFQRETGGLF